MSENNSGFFIAIYNGKEVTIEGGFKNSQGETRYRVSIVHENGRPERETINFFALTFNDIGEAENIFYSLYEKGLPKKYKNKINIKEIQTV